MIHFVTTGRNDPCPCGSGKKYKRCCFDADRLKKTPIQPPPAPLVSTADAEAILRRPMPPDPREPILILEDDGLDDLSNSVLSLVRERRFDEALVACKRLLDDFTDVEDGFERSGIVHAAMGNHALAADFFRRAYAFVNDPVRRDGFDQELIDHYRELGEEQARLAGLR